MVFALYHSTTIHGRHCDFLSDKIRKSKMTRQEVAFPEECRKIKGCGEKGEDF